LLTVFQQFTRSFRGYITTEMAEMTVIHQTEGFVLFPVIDQAFPPMSG
jgi:hypothetical protein